jgi:hypothetical protein
MEVSLWVFREAWQYWQRELQPDRRKRRRGLNFENVLLIDEIPTHVGKMPTSRATG